MENCSWILTKLINSYICIISDRDEPAIFFQVIRSHPLPQYALDLNIFVFTLIFLW